jgi:hypothetical protein
MFREAVLAFLGVGGKKGECEEMEACRAQFGEKNIEWACKKCERNVGPDPRSGR